MRKGEQTRAAILEAALDLASRDGLEGLTIGLLAERMQMSKSGVFAHFGSREDLQVEVVREYHHRFENEVFFPSLRESRGLPRLRAMLARWIEKRIQEPTNAPQADIEAAQKKADALLQQAKSGADFERLAKNNSEANDAKKGGDLGFKSPSALPADVVDAASKLRPGQVNPTLIRVPDGFEIVRLVDRRQSPLPPGFRPLRRRSPGPNVKPNASSTSDTASTMLLPLVTYGVKPLVPSIRTSSEPIVNGFNWPSTRPCASIAAVIPVLVERSIGRPVSSERIRAI
ncbi:peptidylprolyl isomerase, partial [Burkholderia sola]|uniref:peptidylprolyl isomerase n=1 Tax=Burkholderia sola TaxID=2843302 RepID=UPI0030843138